MSQIGEIVYPPTLRFQTLTQWVQMPNMEEQIKKEGLEDWAKYARVWVEKYAPESERFLVQKELPEAGKDLSDKQKEYLKKVAQELKEDVSAEDFQTAIYELAKKEELAPKEAFSAIYKTLLGKDHGPRAAWLILSLDREFVEKRFGEV